ncbi:MULTISPECIES: PLDc N-terminal domain-containing protein [Arthrobacter]|uniref:PLDc N-terminal domain-containing protein n=1 Tax=Arthrobacter sunyaminii TaxID=2816859 RepID=A0A975S5Q9_9MICC|nr:MULTISPECIES: PLDc N-terminal domain-containing protein [Arthrobacter]MBO0909640.1 PLDc N-terminal domain-containing protein [Arthrobacter sunyaminii]QWQ36059.1 PLDc N-terminal domain-containing protein [Arthrobacter sunyaminii]
MPIEYLMWAPLVVLSLVLYLTLAAAALYSLAGSPWVSSSARRGWMLAVVLLPVVGSVLWLAASHRRTAAFPTDGGDKPSTLEGPEILLEVRDP